jgi:hypothetical protein
MALLIFREGNWRRYGYVPFWLQQQIEVTFRPYIQESLGERECPVAGEHKVNFLEVFRESAILAFHIWIRVYLTFSYGSLRIEWDGKRKICEVVLKSFVKGLLQNCS